MMLFIAGAPKERSHRIWASAEHFRNTFANEPFMDELAVQVPDANARLQLGAPKPILRVISIAMQPYG